MKKISLDEWFINAGVLGFKQVLDNYADPNLYRLDHFALYFDPQLLECFSENYFALMMDKYSKYKQDRIKIERYLKRAERPEYFKDQASYISDLAKGTLDKLQKSKIRISDDILNRSKEIHSRLKGIKKIEQRIELEEVSKEYLQLLQNHDVHNLLTLNYLRFILGNIFGQPSFLNPSFTGSLNDFILQFHKDYVVPVIDEIQLQNWLRSIDPEQYQTELKKRSKDKSLTEHQRNLSRNSYNQLISTGKLITCMIQSDWSANIQFEEKMFSPLGLSLNVENFAWNGKQTILISNMTRLLLFCSSLGFSYSLKKVSHASLVVEEYVDTYSFVNLDTSIKHLEQANRDYVNKRDQENPFTEMIFDVVKSTRDQANYVLQNILFVEFSNDGKNSKLQYFHINKKLACFFKKDGELLEKIKFPYFRNLIMEEMVKGRDPMPIIQAQLRKQIQNEKHAYDCYRAIQARNSNFSHTRGDRSVEKNKITDLYQEGKKVARWFMSNSKHNQVQGISYRLLNACKSGNRQLFIDSLLRVYMTANLQIPKVFLNVFHQNELDFEEVGYSFISGLQSVTYQSEEAENNE